MKIRLRGRSTMHSLSHIADQKFKIHPSKMFNKTNNYDIPNRLKILKSTITHFLHHTTQSYTSKEDSRSNKLHFCVFRQYLVLVD